MGGTGVLIPPPPPFFSCVYFVQLYLCLGVCTPFCLVRWCPPFELRVTVTVCAAGGTKARTKGVLGFRGVAAGRGDMCVYFFFTSGCMFALSALPPPPPSPERHYIHTCSRCKSCTNKYLIIYEVGLLGKGFPG